jgi:hypothetical protein
VAENQESEGTGSNTGGGRNFLRQSCFNPFSTYPRTAMFRNNRPNAETESKADAHAYQIEFHLPPRDLNQPINQVHQSKSKDSDPDRSDNGRKDEHYCRPHR